MKTDKNNKKIKSHTAISSNKSESQNHNKKETQKDQDSIKLSEAKMSFEGEIYESPKKISEYFINDDNKVLEKKSPTLLIEKLKTSKIVERSKSDKKEIKSEKLEDHIHVSETIILAEEASFVDEYRTYYGYAIVTDYRFRMNIESVNNNKLRKMCSDTIATSFFPDGYFSIPIASIVKVDKICDKKVYNHYNLNITSRDNKCVKLVIPSEDDKLYQCLLDVISNASINNFTLFSKKYAKEYKWKNYNSIYNIEKEFRRQNIDFEKEKSRYELRNLNENFELCKTYPEYLLLPRFVNKDDIINCSNFRTKNRLPTLVWQYSVNKCCIWRSSQNKSGLTQQRNGSDEKILGMISEYSKKLIIYDARPYINALANRFKGAGFENVNYYTNAEIKFCEIENIHAVRDSVNKLYALAQLKDLKDNKKYFTLLEQTNWFDFIHQILKASLEITSAVKDGYTILVHCSDGWDRTPQLTSLSQLILDKYYRTIEGFIVLIEKEWCSFGHQFAMRNGLYSGDLSEEAPIFLQWLDCIHQLLFQYPSLFEFNLKFINYIASHIYSGLYGTFNYNSCKNKHDDNANIQTISIWSDIYRHNNSGLYNNPFYDKDCVMELIPDYSILKLRLFEEHYLKVNLRYFNQNEPSFENQIIAKNNEHFMQLHLKEKKLLIEKQAKEIDNLKSIIIDLFLLTNKNNLFEQLPVETQNLINSLSPHKDILTSYFVVDNYNKLN